MSLIIFSLFVSLLSAMRHIRNQLLIDAIAVRIKQLRESKGITQEVFYNDTKIHLARIETGQINITISTLEAICKYLNIELQEFFSEPFKLSDLITDIKSE